jgi:hypothetical protein
MPISASEAEALARAIGHELAQAIRPAYAEHIGHDLIAAVSTQGAA